MNLFLAVWRKELNFFIWLTELNFFQFRLKELNFLRYDPNNWTFFLQTQLKFFKIRLTELNLWKKYDSQNWTFFDYDSQKLTISLNMTKELDILEYDAKNWTLYFLTLTQRIKLFSCIWRKDWTLFQIWREELDLFFQIWLKEMFFLKKWLKALNFFLSLRMELFFTVRIKELIFFEDDSQNWTSFFFEYDSQNWTFFTMTQRIELFLFGYDSKIELFFWYGSKNWTSSFIEKDHDSKKWTRSIFFKQKLWLKEFNLFFKKKHDSKN